MKNAITIAFLFLSNFFSLSAQLNSWEILNSGVSADLLSVAFLNDNVGGAVGYLSTVLYTNNGGQSWQKADIPNSLDSLAVFKSIVFTESHLGFICGVNRYNTAIILRSLDSGRTWSIVSDNNLGGSFNDLYFSKDSIGYAVGEKYTNPNRETLISVTTDSGQSWSELLAIKDHVLNAIDCNSQLNCLLIAERPPETSTYYVWSANSIKEKFNQLDNPNGAFAQLSDVKYLTDSRCLLGGGDIFLSDNHGASWKKVSEVPANRFGFFDSNVGYAATGYGANDTIAKTINGGERWTLLPTPMQSKKVYYFDVSAPSINTAYAVGTNGVIVKTITGGGNPLTVANTLTLTEPAFILYTSPSMDLVRAVFSPTPAPRNINVIDILGNNLYSFPIPAETTQTTLTLTELPAGTYFCRLGGEVRVVVVVR